MELLLGAVVTGEHEERGEVGRTGNGAAMLLLPSLDDRGLHDWTVTLLGRL